MNGTFSYKGFLGSREISVEDDCLHGRILFIADLVTYEAETPKRLEQAFRAAVDDYLETCARVGKEPEKSLSGTFNVRVGPELHMKAAKLAAETGVSLNDLVKSALEEKVARSTPPSEGAPHATAPASGALSAAAPRNRSARG